MKEKRYVSECRKRGIKPMRLLRYLKKFTGPRCYGGYFDVSNAWSLWRDTINMCEALGYDTTNETVLFPAELELKHDEVAREQIMKLEREQAEKDAQLREEQKKSLEQRREKYNFEMEGYFIRIAENPEEIIREGKKLMHCVGGYAERHMRGSTTILFLRRCETPGASLYTIEMMGNNLVQVYGYRNEMDGAANGQRGNLAVAVRVTNGNYYKVHSILTPEGDLMVLDNKKTEFNPAGALS